MYLFALRAAREACRRSTTSSANTLFLTKTWLHGTDRDTRRTGAGMARHRARMWTCYICSFPAAGIATRVRSGERVERGMHFLTTIATRNGEINILISKRRNDNYSQYSSSSSSSSSLLRHWKRKKLHNQSINLSTHTHTHIIHIFKNGTCSWDKARIPLTFSATAGCSGCERSCNIACKAT